MFRTVNAYNALMLQGARKRVAAGLLSLIVLSVVGYAVYRVVVVRSPAHALSVIAACTAQKSFIRCVQPAVNQLLDGESGAELMDELEKRFSPVQCHYIGHIVGQELYLRNHSIEDSMAVCNLACDSACAHGIIGQAFADQLGYDGISDVTLDLQHLNPDQIRSVGAKLCTDLDACHGVGHTLFAYYQKFAPAFAVCKSVASAARLSACASGVVMEYADELSSKNFLAATKTQPPSPDTLQSLCDLPQPWQARACFRYFPRMYTAVLKKDIENPETLQAIAGICKTQSTDEYRLACFAGIGSYQTFLLVKDPAAAAAVCNGFGGLRDRAACVYGAITPRTEDRKQQLVSFCEAVLPESLRTACYQNFFHALSQRDGTSLEGAEAVCGANTRCLQGLKNYGLDSWEGLKQVPKNAAE